MANARFLRLVFAGVVALVGCTDPTEQSDPERTSGATGLELIHTQTGASYEIRELSADRRPYALAEPVPLDDGSPVDQDGIVMFEKDGELFYHPVMLARRGINLAESYRTNGDPQYLERAVAHARKLASMAEFHSGAAYYPYLFDHYLSTAGVTLEAPWYSAMSQGQALTLFHRLQEYGDTDEFDEIIEQTYNSFAVPRSDDGAPWVVTRDPAGRIWLEEYPTPDENYHVLNGHIFATYGLYEHFLATGEGRELLEEAIQTVDDAIGVEFRVRDMPSRYATGYTAYDPNYHSIHIRQLRTLAEITGDLVFRHWMGVLICDSPPTQEYADSECGGRSED